ncbi:MAG: ribonuclease P protein component [Rhizobiaceae bacterium]
MAAKNSQPEAGFPVVRLKNRSDFLKARSGARSHERAFVLQLADRKKEFGAGLRVGFTVTKKIGNAVERNRIKRRLREALKCAEIPPSCSQKDAVFIARRNALTLPFGALVEDISHGLRHAGRSNRYFGRKNLDPRRKGAVANHS